MKRLTTALVTTAFMLILGVALLSAPATAVGHPGNSCNPSAGHGRTGCHRVTASQSAARAKAKAKAKAAARKRATQRAAAARRALAKKKAASTPARATIATPAPSTSRPMHRVTAAEPWWVALWHFLFG